MTPEADGSILTGVSETALLTLNGRAHQAALPDAIIDDPMAIRLRDALGAVFAAQQTYSHVVDGRFKGGHITRHFGNPAGGTHAVQLEMTQCSYMQEALPFDYLPERAARIQPTLERLLRATLDFAGRHIDRS